MRVAEFAKEIEKDTKEVVEILKNNGVEVTGRNSITEEQMALVKKSLSGAKPEKKEVKKAEAPKTEAPKAAEPKTEAPKAAEPKTEAPKAEAPKKVENKQPVKKKPNIFIGGMSARPTGGPKPQNGQAKPQGGRPDQNRNQAGKPHTIIKPNVRTSASRLLDEEVKPQKPQGVVKHEQTEQAKPVVKENDKEIKQNVQSNIPDSRSTGNRDSNNRRNNEPEKKAANPSQQGVKKPSGKSFGGSMMRQGQNNNQNQNQGRPNYNNNPAAQAAPTNNSRDDKRKHDKKKDDKNSKFEDGFRGKQGGKGQKVKMIEKPQEKKQEIKEEEKIKVIVVPEYITIKDLADKMKIQPSAIVKQLFLKGQMVTVNQEVSYEDAENIAVEYDILCEHEVVINPIEALMEKYNIEDDESTLVPRSPVICVMGHVDHGKTSLLDKIRNTHVIAKEAGGITQAIGAYVVKPQGSDKKITFLDTPGHEAFTAMRMRGANATDIAILVVAADDGVMPQTVEAINHAKAAGIEVVVAVNKIDKPSANIDRVKQELAEYELTPEDWGGSTVFAPVSAKTGEGIDDLLEMINLTAELHELKANPNRKATGLVIEAELDKGRGPVATVLVQKGTLHVGDFIAAGECHGKVRAMIDDTGRRVKEAGPSTPVEILGLDSVPGAGEIFVCPESDKEAKAYADTFIAYNKTKKIEETKSHVTLEDMFEQIEAGKLKELNLIIKADVQGSVEAVKESLGKLSNEEVVVKVIHSGVGAINESDVILASASNAIIIGFNVRPDAQAKSTSEHEGVEIKLYDVIYKAIEDVEAAMNGMLDPVFEEKVIGHAEIRQIFKASGIGNIAGSYVLDGTFERNCLVRISRQGEQIFEGKLASLKRFKDDVKEVKSGFECGLVFEEFGDFEELDIVEAYKMVEVPR